MEILLADGDCPSAGIIARAAGEELPFAARRLKIAA
jgi:hypothetical protein